MFGTRMDGRRKSETFVYPDHVLSSNPYKLTVPLYLDREGSEVWSAK